jgi:hypothetical protein
LRTDRSSGLVEEATTVGVVLVVLLVALLLGGLGFAVHILWVLAIIVLLFWVIGWALGAGEAAAGRRRWYGRW